jgi:hypothetical protein
MTGIVRRNRSLAISASALVCAVVAGSVLHSTESHRLYVTAGAAALVDRGLAAAAPADAAGFEVVPGPGVRFVANVAQSTTAPWIDSNAWRYKRGLHKAHYAKIAAGGSPLAAAEAFTFGAEAILNPEPGDVEELGKMLQFLKDQASARRLPELVNIALVDGSSSLLGEVMNLLSRRNLLYKVVTKPDPSLLTVQLGSAEFPEQSAANPSDFAARVRAKLGDDKRLVRLYGTSTMIAQLNGDDSAARLYLLSYGGGNRRQPAGPQQAGIRVRVLGRYKPTKLAAYEAPADAQLRDVENLPTATEFSLPSFRTIAIVDLEPLK